MPPKAPTERQLEIVERLRRRCTYQPADVKERYNDQVLIDAAAGTGKTFMLGMLLGAVSDIYFLAPTHRAKSLLVKSLTDSGILGAQRRCFTWHSFFHLVLMEEGTKRVYTAPPNWGGLWSPTLQDWDDIRFDYRDARIIVVDEASMAPKYLHLILSNFRGIVVWCGDSHQLPAIIGPRDIKWSPFELNVTRFRLTELKRFDAFPLYAEQCMQVRESGTIDWIEPMGSEMHDFKKSPILCYRRITAYRHTLRLRGAEPERKGDVVVFDACCSMFVTPSSRYDVLEAKDVTMAQAIKVIRTRIDLLIACSERRLKELDTEIVAIKEDCIARNGQLPDGANAIDIAHAAEIVLQLQGVDWKKHLKNASPEARQKFDEENTVKRAMITAKRLFHESAVFVNGSPDWTEMRCKQMIGGIPPWIDQTTRHVSRVILVDSIEFKSPETEAESVVVLGAELRKQFKKNYDSILEELSEIRKQIILDAEVALNEVKSEIEYARLIGDEDALKNFEIRKDLIVCDKEELLKCNGNERYCHIVWWQLLCNKWVFGLAMTVHKSQGSTFDYAIVDAHDLLIAEIRDPDIYSRLLYVAVSRGSRGVLDISRSYQRNRPQNVHMMTDDEAAFIANCRVRNAYILRLVVDKRVRQRVINCFDISWVGDVLKRVKACRRVLPSYYATPKSGIVSPAVLDLIARGMAIKLVSYRVIMAYVIGAPVIDSREMDFEFIEE
jgi:hypothetical protein